MLRATMIAGCTLCVAACQGADYQAAVPGTDALAPSAVRLQGDVRSNGQVVQIEATIFDTQIRALTGGDSLVLSAPDGASRALEASGSSYVAQLASPSPTVTLELVRRDGSRHPTTFDLPPSFVLVGPDTASRSAPMVVSWPAEPALPVLVEVGADPPACTSGWAHAYPSDPGSFTLQAGDFARVPGTCTVSVRVTRESKAVANGELTVGNVRLQQIRTLALETQP